MSRENVYIAQTCENTPSVVRKRARFRNPRPAIFWRHFRPSTNGNFKAVCFNQDPPGTIVLLLTPDACTHARIPHSILMKYVGPRFVLTTRRSPIASPTTSRADDLFRRATSLSPTSESLLRRHLLFLRDVKKDKYQSGIVSAVLKSVSGRS